MNNALTNLANLVIRVMLKDVTKKTTHIKLWSKNIMKEPGCPFGTKGL